MKRCVTSWTGDCAATHIKLQTRTWEILHTRLNQFYYVSFFAKANRNENKTKTKKITALGISRLFIMFGVYDVLHSHASVSVNVGA